MAELELEPTLELPLAADDDEFYWDTIFVKVCGYIITFQRQSVYLRLAIDLRLGRRQALSRPSM